MVIYKINKHDTIRVETSLALYVRQLKAEIEQAEKSIANIRSVIKGLEETRLKLFGVYHCDEEPNIYNEKLKGIWEGVV